MSSANPTDLVLRPALPDDATAVVEVHLAARRAAVAVGWMPRGVHPDDDVRAWLAGRVVRDEVWVAESDGATVAYLRLVDDWLDDLYVAPAAAAQGIGSALLGVARAVRPGGFGLWVFASNLPARRFYRARGLVEVELTDGSGNEERAPEVRMHWPG
jgi:GNAT superfamily N-acetyltransferase